ncbi:uncharacterized protein LOC130188267 isoform X3 [Pseudoliparis swirei]|uniref:uncharacterized protein LOC130188267 isoform X3 n=1 Tax=Pseudoliparis swirei TaxID=2059687 RepID=UPI0024BE2879|nr:uncharacterized protein LOC130188267 isoform X3 [Pseudoliparis swirei]
MGKCKFNNIWLEKNEYFWLRSVPGNAYQASCVMCRKTFQLGTMGIRAVESHVKSKKHSDHAKARQQPAIASFCSTASIDVNASTLDGTVGNPEPTVMPSDLRAMCGSTPTLQAEVIWVLRTVTSHHSCRSNDGIGEVFKAMFPDSSLVQSFTCGKDKTTYVATFGLAPYIKKELITEVQQCSAFVIMFDETLNQTTKNKQLDLHVRYWINDHVQSRFFGAQFMGHATAQDLLQHFKECVQQLDLRNMISISMDGPNVNWKFLSMLQQEHAEAFGSAQLIVVGSCGLHTLHNAFKCGFSVWQLEKVLRAIHTLFHNSPARREDFCTLTKTSVFPLSFCGHRWIENLPVVDRAIALWPMIVMYVDAVTQKKLPSPRTSSYDTLAEARNDPLIMAKLHFFMAVSRSFTTFLTKYQTDEPVMPFISKDLSVLMKSLLKRFIKAEIVDDITALQMVKLDTNAKEARVHVKHVDIGLGAEAILKVM